MYGIEGKYFSANEEKPEGFYNEYELIIKKDKEEWRFELDMTTNVPQGTMGVTWEGKLVNRADHFAIIIQKQTDWIQLKNDKQPIKHSKKTFETVPVEVYPEEDKIIIYHKNFPHSLELYKVE